MAFKFEKDKFYMQQVEILPAVQIPLDTVGEGDIIVISK